MSAKKSILGPPARILRAALLALALVLWAAGAASAQTTYDHYDPGDPAQKPPPAPLTPSGQNGTNGLSGPPASHGTPTPTPDNTVIINATQPVLTLDGPIVIKAGTGQKGGDGGLDNDTSDTNDGGDGQEGQSVGSYDLTFQSPTVIFNDGLSVITGDGGHGGESKPDNATTTTALPGTGADGGVGGAITLTFDGNVVLGGDFSLATGIGGDDGADGLVAGGDGAAGGNLQVTFGRNLVARQDLTFYFTAGANSLDGGDGGDLHLNVTGNFEIAPGVIVTMDASGMWGDHDDVYFGTLLLNPGSTFTTTAEVNTYNGTSFYNVGNLDVVTEASWITDGTYAPATVGGNTVRIDLSDIGPDHTVLRVDSVKTVSLDLFDPKAQHDAHLEALRDQGLQYHADNEGYRSAVAPPGFLVSAYQTKRLNLGTVTIFDKTQNDLGQAVSETRADGFVHVKSSNSALSATDGDLFDDFAFTAGLRRYYWDLYVDSSQTDNPLVARNYHTADASKVFTQAAAAPGASLVQTFQTTLRAFDDLSMKPTVGGPFGIAVLVGGSSAKTKTGSHVEVDNLSATLVLSRSFEISPGVMAIGAFGEFGRGNYDSHAFIPRYGDVMGDGEVETFGGGLFLKALLNSGTFFEASVRGGSIENEFRLTRDPWTRRPEAHSFRSDNEYVGAHVGVGQRFELGGKTELEGYGRYFWTRTGKDQFTTGFGDEIRLDAIDSSRLRTGARLNMTTENDVWRFYVGAAAEWEFDGVTRGTLNLDPITDPARTKGTSGFGEVGLEIRPDPDGHFSINADGFGWLGRVEGAGGSASLKFEF